MKTGLANGVGIRIGKIEGVYRLSNLFVWRDALTAVGIPEQGTDLVDDEALTYLGGTKVTYDRNL